MSKPKGYWTYENCYNEALKYKSRSEFKQGNNLAYRTAVKNGWIDDYDWFTRPNSKWNYQSCLEEAKKYSRRSEFANGSSGAYHVACINKWVDDYTWLPTDGRHLKYQKSKWNYENCYNEAQKYKSRGEFSKKNESAYNSARKHKWIDDYTWLKDKRLDLYTDKIDCVYAYEFIEQKAVYIGRTLIKRQKERDWEHIFKEDSVSKFAKENNIPVPEMKILETNLTIKEGTENEGIWIELYREDGWTILNIAKAGSIGMIGKGKSKYTYDVCLELSKDCSDKAEFKENYPQAYRISFRNKWLNKFGFKDGKTVGADKRRKYDYQTCYEEAKKYSTITEFENSSHGACIAARKNGWMKDYTWFTILWQEKWNKETCYEEAKKYATLEDFMSKSNCCYSTACKNKWIDDYTWLERKHVKSGYWKNYDNCYNEAKKYDRISYFNKNAPGAYSQASKNGWMKDYTWFKKKKN